MDISGDTVSGNERNKVLDQGLLQQLLECDNVQHIEKTRLLEVVGDASGVTGVRERHPQDEGETTIEVEGAFVYGAGGGSKPITDFVQSKVSLDEHSGVIVDADMKTSVDGVYTIGDINNTDYKLNHDGEVRPAWGRLVRARPFARAAAMAEELHDTDEDDGNEAISLQADAAAMVEELHDTGDEDYGDAIAPMQDDQLGDLLNADANVE